MTTFHSLTVAKVEPETRDAVTITFAVPQALQEAYRFRPGQHLTLKTRLGADELRRCYSICRSSAPGEISVAVKAIEGGRFSRYARDEIKPGMTLEVMVPRGILAISHSLNGKVTIWRLPQAPASPRCWRFYPPRWPLNQTATSP